MSKWIEYKGKGEIIDIPTVHFNWTQIYLNAGALAALSLAKGDAVTLHFNPDDRQVGIKAAKRGEDGALIVQANGAISFSGFLKRFRLHQLEIATTYGQMVEEMLIAPIPNEKKKRARTIIGGKWGEEEE